MVSIIVHWKVVDSGRIGQVQQCMMQQRSVAPSLIPRQMHWQTSGVVGESTSRASVPPAVVQSTPSTRNCCMSVNKIEKQNIFKVLFNNYARLCNSSFRSAASGQRGLQRLQEQQRHSAAGMLQITKRQMNSYASFVYGRKPSRQT